MMAPKWAKVTSHMGMTFKQWGIVGLSLLVVASVGVGMAQPDDHRRPIPAQPLAGQTLPLTAEQMASVKVEPAVVRVFRIEREAMGSIAFDDELTVQVFPNYQGKILQHRRELGDDVHQGDVLYTLESPDLIQAESTLLATAGVRELTTRALDRARQLLALQGLAEKDYQQAVSDQQTAEASYQAARRVLHVFGKSEAQVEHLLATKQLDSVLPVLSPLTGKVSVVAMSAAVGTFVQPGSAPAPYAVSDLSTLWMLANVAESDVPLLKVGEAVQVRVLAFPNRIFQATIAKLGVVVDPNTHRLPVRCVIHDAKHELHPGMMASFTIRAGADQTSVALPLGGLVREGDGHYSAWVEVAPQRFERRQVQVGEQQDGRMQIFSGLQPGERVATDGAIFLSNAFAVAADAGN